MATIGLTGHSRLASYVSRLALIAAILFSLVYAVVAVTRVVYPYDLDFIEDSMLMQSLRIANGQPVYGPPNAEFVPHVYMPLYTWLGAWLFKVAGPGFTPLRLISLCATLTTAALIYLIARRESGRRWLAVACAGVWLGGYRISDGWYELARVDALSTTLSLGGLALGIYGRGSNRGVALSAIVMALAFLTKQTGLVIAAALTIHLLASIGRRAWLFAGAYGALASLSVVWLNGSTSGWFGYYAFHIASSNPVEAGRAVDYVRFELFGLMAALSLMAVAAAWLAVRRWRAASLRHRPWLLGMGAAILVSGVGRVSVGGAMNNLMPAYALLCLAPALLMAEWPAAPFAAADPSERRPGRFSRVGRRFAWQPDGWIAVLILVQFALGAYNPLRFVPSAAMRRSGDRLIARVASTPGEVFVMLHPYYALLAGKPPSAQIAVVWHARDRGTTPLPSDLAARIETRYYAAIISDETLFETDPALVALLEANYARGEELLPDESPPTMTGMFARPRVVYVPKP